MDFTISCQETFVPILNAEEDRGLQISPIIGRDALKIFEASPTGQVFPCGSEVSHSTGGYFYGRRS